DIDGAVVTLPGNSGTSEIVYTFTGYYSSYQAENHATVYGSDSGHTYSNLSVSASYTEDISAGGGGVYPTVSISVKQDNRYILTGTAENGATSCTVSDGSHSTVIAISYSNGANGFISAESRGSVPGLRQEIASCRVDVSKAMRNETISASSTASAWQAANIETTGQGSFILESLSAVPLVNGQALPTSSGSYQLDTAAATDVYVQVLATGHGTTTRYSYTSGVVVGGDTVNLDNEPVTPRSVSVTVGQTAITVDNQTFSASNIHVLQTRTYSIAALYEGTTANTSLVQAADEKIDGEAQVTVTLSEEANSNTLWAGGGEVILRGSAFQESGKFWKSDGARVEGETSPPVYILNQIALNPSNTTHFTIYPKDTYSTYKTFRVTHRDMENNVTTDTLSITANVGTVYTNPLSYSVSNQLEPDNWFRENAGTVWNDYFPKERTYEIYFEISRYTSDSDRAPSRANGVISTTYSVLARHSMYYYRTGVENTNKYIPYTSWSQEHNDDNHRYLDSVDSLPVWEWGNFIEWVTDTPSISRPSTDSWLTINATSNTGGTLIFAQQTVGGERRGTTVTAMNPSDPSTNRQTISIGVFQNRYQNITVTPTTIPTFSWDRPGTATISVYAENVPFQISRSTIDSDWYNMYISIGGTTPVVVEEDTDYGSANTSQLFTIEIHPGINTGLQHFTTLWIKAQEIQDVLQPIGVTLSQEAYDPGPSNND
ncbi:MAG: hypothetical protein II661_04300, partial [Bacteroidales bacterium]|nr:hypothetical protein [Bacteroidales bacterium]